MSEKIESLILTILVVGSLVLGLTVLKRINSAPIQKVVNQLTIKTHSQGVNQ